MQDLAQQLAQRRAQSLLRERLLVQSPQGVELELDGERLLAFCSNDYLGLANDPRVVAAFKDAAERYGVGSGASHLITGHSVLHHELELALAEFVVMPRALLFSTGYMANLAVLSSLLQRHDRVLEDRLNHASLIDAARLSQAKLQRYAHADSEHLRTLLEAAPPASLIATDAVFSMDGDIAPLAELKALAQAHQAWLLVDDAHGLGVLGEQGRGSLSQLGVAWEPGLILMGTLGKALGCFGAFVAGEDDLIETLIQQGRTYIYTTALPPAVAGALLASLKIVQQESWRREHLMQLVARFRAGAQQLELPLMPSTTPIQPLLLGSAERALQLSARLRQLGILVTPIRPPTVPVGSARLRISFSAAHSEAHVDQLLQALASAMQEK